MSETLATGQFGVGLSAPHEYTPVYSSKHVAPGASAYGTTHPADVALGRAYRLQSLAGTASGGGEGLSASEKLHAASATMAAGSRSGSFSEEIMGGLANA